MMNTKQIKVAAPFAALIVGAVICAWPGLHAQEKAAPGQLSTNWIGGLVVGKKEKGDPIAGRGLFPQVEGDVEIGLRSDGVVVWRKAQR
jgi:hypothetical protein